MSHYLNPMNLEFIEELEKKYEEDPESIDPSWKYFFDGMALSRMTEVTASNLGGTLTLDNLEFEIKVLELIQGYREMGHLIADVNPLNRGSKTHELVALSTFGLSDADLDRVSQVGRVVGLGPASLRDLIKALETYYCSPAAVEYGHIEDPKARHWLQKRVESNYLAKPFPRDIKMKILQKLTEAEVFETFLHKRFVGQKRFSVEGNDVILPMIDFIIEESTKLGADEIIIGMAHRGRLNVLVNIFQKDLKNMLAEFSGNLDAEVGDGDVKYHMGFSKDSTSWSGKPVHLSLMPNPSHLEAVNPVLMGVTRAKQKLKGENGRNRTLAILLHGDASFCGQGIIYETLNMSELRGYSVGGIIHIIVNNQVGFTTSPIDSRSTPQVTDISKMLEIPIFHVNADEPEAALRCAALGLHYRYKFYRDVVIDVVGYRRYGHNESDEPTFTQPVMYKNINSHPRVREIYAQKLAQGRIIEEAQSQELMNQYEQRMEAALDEAKKGKVSPMMQSFGERWKTLAKPDEKGIFSKIETAVSIDVLKKVGQTILTVPANFNLHPKIKKLVEDRQEMIDEKRPLDWGLGEALAFGSLVQEGLSVRLAGQDAERGTFSHRQSVWHDVVTGEKYSTINAVKNEKADFKVINSLLSEYAALGFEFGQSLANPNKLVIWEAQFGDFANGAQIIIDQFITCSSYKWQRYSGLVMLLPHGYEGQGPEHSSARLERFLQMCAQNNIQVCNLTTPAQIFHALRRQLHRAFRLPLIVMSPKSLLRHPSAVSPLADFTHGSFQELIDDDDPETILSNRVIFCSGKIYYDLVEARKQAGKKVPIVRVEQLYPFAQAEWKRILARYTKAEEIIWCQEAPQNMESWNFIAQHLPPLVSGNKKITYVGRAAQASPADSYMHLHQKEQKRIVATALGI